MEYQRSRPAGPQPHGPREDAEHHGHAGQRRATRPQPSTNDWQGLLSQASVPMQGQRDSIPPSSSGEPQQYIRPPQHYHGSEGAGQLPFPSAAAGNVAPSVHFMHSPSGPHAQVAHPMYMGPTALSGAMAASGPAFSGPPSSMISSTGEMAIPMSVPHMHGWQMDPGLGPVMYSNESHVLPTNVPPADTQHPQMQVLLPAAYGQHVMWPPGRGASGSASAVLMPQAAQLPGPHMQVLAAEHLPEPPPPHAPHSPDLQLPHLPSVPMHGEQHRHSMHAHRVLGGGPPDSDASRQHGFAGAGDAPVRSWAPPLDSFYEPGGGLQLWPGPAPSASGGTGGGPVEERRPQRQAPQKDQRGEFQGGARPVDRKPPIQSSEQSEVDGRDGDEPEGTAEQASVTRLKALLSQCPPRPEVFAAILSHLNPAADGGAALTLPAITKLLSKLNKRGQWQHGLALFWALPALGMQADAPMANAALGACDRGKDGDSAWRIYSFMLARGLLMDSITFKALISALAKVDHWRRCCAVFVRALDAAVALEAVSVMVLLFSLVRAGRWDVAEAVFLCAYEALCDTSALLAVQPALLSPGAAAAASSFGDAAADVPDADRSAQDAISSAAAISKSSETATSSTVATQSTHTASTTSNSRSGNSHEAPLTDLLGGVTASGEAAARASPVPGDSMVAAACMPLAPCPTEADVLLMLMDLHGRISDAKRRSAATGGLNKTAAKAAHGGTGTHRAADGRAPSAGDGVSAVPRGSTHAPAATAKRALPRCRSVTSQLTVNRSAKTPTRAADAQDTLLARRNAALQELCMDRVCAAEGLVRGAPVPGRRPSPNTQLPPFPSIPEETIPVVEPPTDPGGVSVATATSASNSLGFLKSPGSGGSVVEADAAVAALLPQPPAGGPDDGRVPAELRQQLQQQRRHQQLRQGAVAAAAAPQAQAVSDDALDVLRGMVEDPVARACANALLRAYAHGPIPETLRRATALLTIMQKAGGNLSVDVTSVNTVVSMHCDVGDVVAACDLLRQLPASGLQPTAATYRPLFVEATGRTDGGPLALQLWQHLRHSGVSPDLDIVNGFIGAVMQLSDPGLTAAALEDCLPYLDGTAAAAAAVPSGAWPQARP